MTGKPANVRLALLGVGAIGLTHLAALKACPELDLAGILDPAPGAADLAAGQGAALYPTLEALIADRPDGAIIATPNALHAPQAAALLRAGIPVLIEKPVTESVAQGDVLRAVQAETGVAVLVGHHRRHLPLVVEARARIAAGEFGRLVTGSVNETLYKPDSYFAPDWRRRAGEGGPILINLIHEIDLLRHLFGEIATVSALVSTRERGLAVEDTAAILLDFAGGGLVTITVTDRAVGPWSWEATSNENPGRWPYYPIASQRFAGTKAGLSLPDLGWWTFDGAPDWTRPQRRATLRRDEGDCYIAQLRHFAAVIAGREAPLVTLDDGVANLRVIDAIRAAAASGRRVSVDLGPAKTAPHDHQSM